MIQADVVRIDRCEDHIHFKFFTSDPVKMVEEIIVGDEAKNEIVLHPYDDPDSPLDLTELIHRGYAE